MAFRALLHFNGTNGSTTFTDAVGTLAWTRSGTTAVLDTSTPKFGSAELTLTTGQVDCFGTTFTIPTTWTADLWFNVAVTGTRGIVAFVGPSPGNVTGATFNGNGSGNTYRVSLTGTSADFSVTGTKTVWATGTDYHFEMNYDSVAQKFYFYIDGVKDGEITSATPMSGAGWRIEIGNNGVGTSFNGSIDEFRFTDATEHPSGTTFTPPTSEYTLPIVTGTGAMTLAGVAPALFSGVTIAPAAGTLVLTGQLASVSNSGQRNIAPNAGALVVAGTTPFVLDRPYPVSGVLSIAGAAPTIAVVANQNITPGTGALAITEGTPQVAKGAVASITRRQYKGTGQASAANTAYGNPVLRKRSALGYAGYISAPVRRSYKGAGQASQAVIGAPVRRSYQSLSVGAVLRRRKYTSAGQASSVLAATYRTHAMNTVINAVTEFTGFRFNSYAQINGAYYGAGPDGLVRLDGTDDAGANIDWKVRTGQIDDRQIGLKRLPEVVMGLRASGPVRVRVYPNDNQFFDYMLPNINTSTIRQHRVKPGKKMKSRYFTVELQGTSNAAMELDSLQLNLTPTTRRLG